MNKASFSQAFSGRLLKRILPIFIGILLLIVGCSNEETKEEQNATKQASSNNEKSSNESTEETLEKNQTEDLEVRPLPTTYKELEALPAGKDSEYIPTLTNEDKERAVERFNDLPDIKDNPSTNELDYYYQELLERVQQDYEGPESLIKQLKFQSLGNPQIEDSRYQFKENLNVEVILDASGSMAQDVGGKTKMEAAKEEILKFVEGLPEGAKVGLRVYGHKGSNADSAKELSCKSSEIVYPINIYETSKFQTALDQVNPTGWTPITLALNEAKKDLSKYDGKNNTNIVYLVSDGIETCDQDPLVAAKELYNSNVSPIINVIGFNVNAEGQQQLKEIAESTEGIYQNVKDQTELKSELDKINEIAKAWDEWKEKGEQSIDIKETKNSLDIFGYITDEQVKVTDERLQINLLMYTFYEHGYMDNESRIYLEEKNNKYHKWIDEEISKFNQELKSLNEKNYEEAKKALEEKYEINTQ
ncbi:VWA domain-containing protein [Bacillus spongiae]|uniref:VWA domain-containing protein n=1 Tax=Bacillus spongiae TaxID=2683610 RepID=A0ABU8HE48_9BACI